MTRPKKDHLAHLTRVASAREEKQAIERIKMEERLRVVVQKAREEGSYGVPREIVRMRGRHIGGLV